MPLGLYLVNDPKHIWPAVLYCMWPICLKLVWTISKCLIAGF